MFSLVKNLTWISLLFISISVKANFQPLAHFGDNPGELSASYLKASKQAKSLVVLLHGCVQNGETLARQSGFVALAQQHDFILLIPQQNNKNNVKSCFNWFSEQDISKDKGEVLSIKNMITTLQKQVDAEQVYIAGLSAGGAMTSALLTHYPNVFSAGAVVAGLPYPCANDLAKAISCMRNGPSQSIAELVTLAKRKNEKVLQWPRLIVITGTNDNVVNPKNSHQLAWQWSTLSEKPLEPNKILYENYQRTLWQNTDKETLVELLEINEIGHGLTVNSSLKNREASASFIYESSLDSASDIVRFWGFK
ncbi:extracellular catalytic domain type 1 short-chain-length polyhydroxyalkanoate depolymerase [Colwellia sp. 12G3]|uniref:extracellular catalytic domain type 1 short-chain-length polyhydroxyalkanoate depolymerase n=1 Tax=Colwellia sp. 12G3 TaxID=2058299 RepID=UPI000C34C06C|nr:PHB depolymerase family esterase [Colwellia sp. 12G3]PKI14069.1 esterase [Colwellia sp. 12G3]